MLFRHAFPPTILFQCRDTLNYTQNRFPSSEKFSISTSIPIAIFAPTPNPPIVSRFHSLSLHPSRLDSRFNFVFGARFENSMFQQTLSTSLFARFHCCVSLFWAVFACLFASLHCWLVSILIVSACRKPPGPTHSTNHRRLLLHSTPSAQ